jgi:hypothetical protein
LQSDSKKNSAGHCDFTITRQPEEIICEENRRILNLRNTFLQILHLGGADKAISYSKQILNHYSLKRKLFSK